MKSCHPTSRGANSTVAGNHQASKLWLSRELRSRSPSTAVAPLETAKGRGDGCLGLLLGALSIFRALHGVRLRRRLALLVRALADLEALDRVRRNIVGVDDVALGGVLGVAV